jgi:hypothetical protein
MNPHEFLMAVALLTAVPDTPEAVPTAEEFATLRQAIQAVALEWEILDPREVRYLLARPEDFEADINLLRRRYQELADAPPLIDCERFPDRETINDLLAFNRSYRQYLDARLPMHMARWWELRTALQETDQLYQVWDTVRDARCDYYYVTVRRQALKKLRDLIGPELYTSGQMPPYVPLWRFELID